jgi:hypothetical protein
MRNEKNDPQPGIQKPQKTLKQLCDEAGIKEVPADDPIYQNRWSLYLRVTPQRDTRKPQGSDDNAGQGQHQPKLIDRNSKEPQDRLMFLDMLAEMTLAFQSHPAEVVGRVKAAAQLAKLSGVRWEDLYDMVKSSQGERYPEPPDLDLVDPES